MFETLNSCYAPSANKLMQLGYMNFTTNKWIDISGNSNDADLVDAYCADFTAAMTATTPAFEIGANDFDVEVFYKRGLDTTFVVLRNNTAGTVTLYGQAGTDYTNISLMDKDTAQYQYSYFHLTEDDLFHKYNYMRVGGNLKFYKDGVEISTSGGTLKECVANLGSQTYTINTTGKTGTIFGLKITVNGVLFADYALSGSLLDRSGNGHHMTQGATAVNVQAKQNNKHYNLQYGCDIYSADSDPTDRALWYYVPYTNAGVPVTDATGAATQAGYAVTLLRNCLPYRADAPLNLSETKIKFKSTLPLDIMNKAPAAALPDGKDNSAGCIFNGKFIITGGKTIAGATTTNKVFTSPNNVHWTELTQVTPFTARRKHVAVVLTIGGVETCFILGGEDASGSIITTDLVYKSTDLVNWTEVVFSAGNIWGGREAHAGCIYNGKIYVSGGFDASLGKVNDVWSWDGVSAAWTKVKDVDSEWPVRYCHSMISHGGKLIISGGYDDSNGLSDVWTSTTGAALSWTRVKTDNIGDWSRRINHGCLSDGTYIYIFGGWTPSPSTVDNDCWRSMTGADGTWALMSAACWAAGKQQVVAVYMNGIIMVGSAYNSASAYNTVDGGATWEIAEISDPAKMSGTAFYDGTSDATKHTHYQEELNGKFRNDATRDAFKGYSFFGSYAEEVDASLYGLKGRYRAGIIYSAKQIGAALRNINKFCHGENY